MIFHFCQKYGLHVLDICICAWTGDSNPFEFIVWEGRFTYFCKVALEHMVKLRKQADIIHLHNWQTAAVAPMFWDLYAHQVQTKPNKGLQCYAIS